MNSSTGGSGGMEPKQLWGVEGSTSLSLGSGESPGSPLNLHWHCRRVIEEGHLLPLVSAHSPNFRSGLFCYYLCRNRGKHVSLLWVEVDVQAPHVVSTDTIARVRVRVVWERHLFTRVVDSPVYTLGHFFFFFFFLKIFIYLFIWLHRLLVAARGIFIAMRGIFSCGMQDP